MASEISGVSNLRAFFEKQASENGGKEDKKSLDPTPEDELPQSSFLTESLQDSSPNLPSFILHEKIGESEEALSEKIKGLREKKLEFCYLSSQLEWQQKNSQVYEKVKILRREFDEEKRKKLHPLEKFPLIVQEKICRTLQVSSQADMLAKQYIRLSPYLTVSSNFHPFVDPGTNPVHFRTLIKLFLTQLSECASQDPVQEWEKIVQKDQNLETCCKSWFELIHKESVSDKICLKLENLFSSLSEGTYQLPLENIHRVLLGIELEYKKGEERLQYILNNQGGKIELISQGVIIPTNDSTFEIIVSNAMKTDIHKLPFWTSHIQLQLNITKDADHKEIEENIVTPLKKAGFHLTLPSDWVAG